MKKFDSYRITSNEHFSTTFRRILLDGDYEWADEEKFYIALIIPTENYQDCEIFEVIRIQKDVRSTGTLYEHDVVNTYTGELTKITMYKNNYGTFIRGEIGYDDLIYREFPMSTTINLYN